MIGIHRNPHSTDGGRGLDILSAYNEIDSIAGIVESVLAQDDRPSVLIDDDASPDGTRTLVDSLAKRSQPCGKVLRGKGRWDSGPPTSRVSAYALERDLEGIFEMDTDGTR